MPSRSSALHQLANPPIFSPRNKGELAFRLEVFRPPGTRTAELRLSEGIPLPSWSSALQRHANPHQILTEFGNNDAMRVLIVEDEPDIAIGLETALKRQGFHVDWAADGSEGEKQAIEHPFGVILLDVMLPKKDGIQVCRTLRQLGITTPILMLTARDAVDDRVNGLDAGADDYLVKPFALEELLARIRALTRRDAERKASSIPVGDLVVDTLAQSVRRGQDSIHLTKREYELMEALARNKDRVLTREVILARIWNNEDALPNTVNFHMASLRKKVDPDGKLIETVHGFGYTIRSGSGHR